MTRKRAKHPARSKREKKAVERRQIWHYLCRAHGKRRKTYNFEVVRRGICPTCFKNKVPENQTSLFPITEPAADPLFGDPANNTRRNNARARGDI